MNDRVAIITGAGSGIGRATAIELARLGYQLALCGRHAETLEQTATIAGNGLPLTADVTSPDDVSGLVEKTLSHFGRVDVIVNNAGFAPVLSVEQTSIADWRAVIDTNLSAAFYLAKAVWPTFRRQQSGVIVNISSMAARDPFPGFLAYASAKGGLNLLSLSLAREGGKMGIRVYTVAPGAVETAMFRRIMTPEQFPADQTLEPAEVAGVIGQCVTGDSKYVSGEVIWMKKS